MSELRTTETMDVSARLAREVGLIARRLARFLEASLRGSESAVAEGTAFLWAMFESVSEGRPPESWSRNPLGRAPAGEIHPLDRVARSMSLSPEDVELLLFAGLSEEHEGLAAILRTMHPRGEPRATVGLGA